jgi:flagellar hook-length control protein FliK
MVVQRAGKGPAGPVNAATAIAAQNAAAEATRGGKTGEASNAAVARTATATKTTGKGESADPTAKALKDILSGDREGGGRRNAEDSSDPRAQRLETRPISQRTAPAGMSPAMRAAAEAVQQQFGGSYASATANGTGPGDSQSTTQAAQQALRAEGSAPSAGQATQSFDPVLQNNGPQPGGAGQPGGLAAAGKAAPSAGTGPGNPAPTTPPAEQIAVQIQRAAAQGQNRVQIRLNPAELGRIDVKVEVGDDGHVRAALAVDKPETLDLMQRDPRALERALQAAGLKTDQDSLNFSLRDDGTGEGKNSQNDDNHRPGGKPGPSVGDATADQPIPADQLLVGLSADERVDIRV